MRSSLKYKIILMTVLIVMLTFLIRVFYLAIARQKSTDALTTGIYIIDVNELEVKKQQKNESFKFAIKVQEENNEYLRVFSYNPDKDTFVEYRLDFSKENFSKLKVGGTYWFHVKLYNKDNTDSGKVVTVYKDNPVQ